MNFFGWIPNVISRALDSIWNGSKSNEQSPTQWISKTNYAVNLGVFRFVSFSLFIISFLLFVSFNKAVKLYVISVNFLNLTFETTRSKIDLDHPLFLSIAADNVKELPITLKYTIYSTMTLWQMLEIYIRHISPM